MLRVLRLGLEESGRDLGVERGLARADHLRHSRPGVGIGGVPLAHLARKGDLRRVRVSQGNLLRARLAGLAQLDGAPVREPRHGQARDRRERRTVVERRRERLSGVDQECASDRMGRERALRLDLTLGADRAQQRLRALLGERIDERALVAREAAGVVIPHREQADRPPLGDERHAPEGARPPPRRVVPRERGEERLVVGGRLRPQRRSRAHRGERGGVPRVLADLPDPFHDLRRRPALADEVQRRAGVVEEVERARVGARGAHPPLDDHVGHLGAGARIRQGHGKLRERPESVLRLPLLVNVGVDPHPARDVAALVAYRCRTGQEPAARAVVPAQREGHLERLARRERSGPLLHDARKERGIVDGLPAPALHLLGRRPRVFVPALVVVVDPAVSPGFPAELRHRVEELAQLLLGAVSLVGGLRCTDTLRRAGDVGDGDHRAHDGAGLVLHGGRAGLDVAQVLARAERPLDGRHHAPFERRAGERGRRLHVAVTKLEPGGKLTDGAHQLRARGAEDT